MVQNSKESYETLLSKARGIIDKDNLLYKEKEKRGELFNVFSILGLDVDELSHSSFIAELLNPLGMHGRGDVFLKAFLECIEIKPENFCNISVQVEKDIGPLNADKTEGGRIDIIIEFGKTYSIVIENKIRAEDQENQLIRYENYLKKQNFTHYSIIYLTLDGHSPQSSKGVKNLICISYKQHILHWLEKCTYIAIQQPLIRENVIQYMDLIKGLTGKTMSMETSSEMVKLLLEGNNILVASEMSKELENARQHFLRGGDSGHEGIVSLLKNLELENISFDSEAKYIDFNDKRNQYTWSFGIYKKENLHYQLILGFNELTNSFSQIQFAFYLSADNKEHIELNEKIKESLAGIFEDFKRSWGKSTLIANLKGHRSIDKIIADKSEKEQFQNDVKEMVLKIFQILES